MREAQANKQQSLRWEEKLSASPMSMSSSDLFYLIFKKVNLPSASPDMTVDSQIWEFETTKFLLNLFKDKHRIPSFLFCQVRTINTH